MSKINKRSNDPVAFTLDLIGDKWSLIIIRDMIYHKKNSYNDFLKSDERISTSILNDRLIKLIEMKNPKKALLTYLYCYLLSSGAGFLIFPSQTLSLFQSNGTYGDVMPRMVGLFMIGIGGLIFLFAKNNDFKYYGYSLLFRTFACICAVTMYFIYKDPLFITLLVIVLLGLIPSFYYYFKKENQSSRRTGIRTEKKRNNSQ